MRLDEDTCYKALTARDERFDGLFFVGVTTTGVYCRPVCPAKTPGATRCVYFSYAAEAEKAGYRACFRCRPECAPGRSTLESVSNKVAKAWQLIEQGYLDQHSVEDLANTLSVTSRHLRRAIKHELGVGPNELAQTRRLKVAKHLLQDTHLPISMIAMASGFSSLRRFNSAFSACFHTQPQSSRVAKPEQQEGRFSLRLDYRPPLDWRYMLEYLKLRVVPSIESVIGYHTSAS